MFCIFNLTREEARDHKIVNDRIVSRDKVKDEKSDDEPCFGGFRSRWSYEDCRRGKFGFLRGTSPFTAAMCALVLVFLGICGLAGGIIIYDFVQDNRVLYYPAGIFPAAESSVPENPPAVSGNGYVGEKQTVGASVSSDSTEFVTVTAELSRRYRIPRGVMIQSVGAGESCFLVGDIIVAVNGNEVIDLDSFNEQGANCADGDIITIRIFRRNRYIDVVIDNTK